MPTLDELDQRTIRMQTDLDTLRADVEAVKKMGATFATAILDVEHLSDALKRAHDELVDRDAKMIASIKQIIDARQTPQDQQLALLTVRAQERDRMRRVQVMAMVPGIGVLALGMWLKLPTEASMMMAGAAWLAMRQALGLVTPKDTKTDGTSLPPKGM